MDSNEDQGQKSVTVSMELTGRYEDVVGRLHRPTNSDPTLEAVLTDVSELLDAVVRIDGGTKSVIAEEMGSETNVEYDPEMVVSALQVLEAYDLVALEGNTWMPGPAT